MSYHIVILGLSITSSWGNGHATTYRALVRELVRRGHDVLFLERDVPWYAAQRDLPHPSYGRTVLYHDLEGLRERFAEDVRQADVVMVGSFVPEGVAVGRWVTEVARGMAGSPSTAPGCVCFAGRSRAGGRGSGSSASASRCSPPASCWR